MDHALQFSIQDLGARYAHAIDDDRLEEWPEFFTEKGRYIVTTADNAAQGLPAALIYATSRAIIRDRVKSLREANIYEGQRYRHVIGTPLIAKAENGSIVSRSSFLVVRIMHTGESILFATGVYRDRIEVAGDGTLRLAERIVVLDSQQIDTLLAIPL